MFLYFLTFFNKKWGDNGYLAKQRADSISFVLVVIYHARVDFNETLCFELKCII